MRPKLHLVWFVHQPFFIPDHELVNRVHSTYFPVLDIHCERQIPISFGITGSTLDRISKLVPEFVSFLRELVSQGWVRCIETAAFHPILPDLDRYWINRQILFDQKIKHDLGVPTVPVFWPTELAWSPRLADILRDRGQRLVIVDDHCVSRRNSRPSWKKSGHHLIAEAPSCTNIARHSKIRLERGETTDQPTLDVISRNGRVSNGLVSIVHNNETYSGKLEAFSRLLQTETQMSYELGDIIVMGEDPERILPERLGEYLVLLDHLVDSETDFCGIDELQNRQPSAFATHIPSGTMQGDASLWSTSIEDKWYRRQLDDVLRQFDTWRQTANLPEIKLVERRIMQIQDSGFFFWPYIARTRAPFFDAMAQIEHSLRQEKI